MHKAMQTAFTYRKAVLTDLPRIVEIYEHIWARELEGPKVCGWRKEYYPSEEIARNAIRSGEMLVQELDGVITASFRLNQVQDEVFYEAKWEADVPESEILVLHLLAADPEYRGIGCGKAILKYYEEQAVAMGCTVLRMDTGGTNSRARKIYQDMGFTETDELVREYGSAIFLEKCLV